MQFLTTALLLVWSMGALTNAAPLPTSQDAQVTNNAQAKDATPSTVWEINSRRADESTDDAPPEPVLEILGRRNAAHIKVARNDDEGLSGTWEITGSNTKRTEDDEKDEGNVVLEIIKRVTERAEAEQKDEGNVVLEITKRKAAGTETDEKDEGNVVLEII
ncbi:hypothetical protein K461DRAFT_322040 [Myriangium duriaei CBS 260.36]|uniref:Uncharacterized protein n=1 Tax=Myriangium duriaei CBS 260.36 TaxID=1168546 RepID=A0A9P4IXU8_9PEZI|nr:hypothetical protein K461DRAFT_322040 [Myriangium duriaei CBS 260.36]